MTELSVVIPSYNRGEILLDTIALLLDQSVRPDEIIIVDQTHYPEANVTSDRLADLHSDKKINWIRLAKPSIPHAMNVGLNRAKCDHVLFLDDDVSFNGDFIQQHKRVLTESNHRDAPCHVGQILQPWQTASTITSYGQKKGLLMDLDFPFNSNQPAMVHNCMAGNLCVNRRLAISIGGFDEQFEQVAYRFETEFCRRMIRHTKSAFLFAPNATLNHLKIPTGGTRKHAENFLTSPSGSHSVGDYYFALTQPHSSIRRRHVYLYIIKRFTGSIIAKFYLKKPWWIPVRLVAEFTGLLNAIKKVREGPKYLELEN